MKINIDYKTYFYFLKTTKKLKTHYLIESNFLYSKKYIFDILKILICKKHADCLDKCFECDLIENENLDYFFIFDINNKNQVDEIKKLLFWVSLKEINKKKFFWIPQCELLTKVSSNKLLKFLEESPENIHGFFTTNFKEKMNSTILSRLIILKFLKNKYINNFSKKNKLLIEQISSNFKNFNLQNFEKEIIFLKELTNKFINKIEEKKINDFLFYSNEDFLLKNFWIFLDVLVFEIQNKLNLNKKWIKIIKIIMYMISKNKELFKISNNYMSSRINLILLINNIEIEIKKSIK